MEPERPDPNLLLARVQADTARTGRGRLKVFFGYAPGVGKTFAMLQAARREKAEGVEVVVGYVEPHGRVETESLLEGLEVLPTRPLPQRGITLAEFDLDAALARRPKLLLVDELAHTNAEGSRHARRWQDVEELLGAGIDVWTTLNVQHLESLNDVIAQITGVVVRETIPDAVIERADEIVLIDLTPDELAERLRDGKVYVSQQAERALRNFFHPSNLVALRELALREAADRLHQDVEAARDLKTAPGPWQTRERLLVCVGPSPSSARLIRTTKRMADGLNAEWLAVAVNTRGDVATPDPGRERVSRHLSLAARLGAQTQMLVEPDVANALLNLARARNVSKIIVGKTERPWWARFVRRSVVDRLLDNSGDIDIYVIRGRVTASAMTTTAGAAPQAIPWMKYLMAGAVVFICALLGWLGQSQRLAEANTVMIFLLGVVVVATRLGRGPAIATAVVSVLVFDFFFVPPYLSFSVDDAQYLITFAIMLGIGLLVSALTTRLRERLQLAQAQEHRTGALYRLTRQMSEVVGIEFLIQTAGRQLAELFAGEVVIFIREPGGPISLRFGESTTINAQPVNAVVAQWVADHEAPAGWQTDTLPNATALFVPLTGSQRTVGAIGVRPRDPDRFLDPEQRRLLDTCASLIALSVERDESVLQAQHAHVQAETEQMRSSLLSSVSHDLRTPLAAITGVASTLLEQSPPTGEQHDLLQTVVDESRRLTRLVENLLEMTRYESGAVTPNRQWHVLEEIVGTAIRRARGELGSRTVRTALPADLPLLFVDELLIEQVLINLLENAGRCTPADACVEVSACVGDRTIEMRVADNGPGLPPGSEQKLFDKFERGPAAGDSHRGVGLGLAICRAAVLAHGGTIAARNRPTGGAEFIITLPAVDPPPVSPTDEGGG